LWIERVFRVRRRGTSFSSCARTAIARGLGQFGAGLQIYVVVRPRRSASCTPGRPSYIRARGHAGMTNRLMVLAPPPAIFPPGSRANSPCTITAPGSFPPARTRTKIASSKANPGGGPAFLSSFRPPTWREFTYPSSRLVRTEVQADSFRSTRSVICGGREASRDMFFRLCKPVPTRVLRPPSFACAPEFFVGEIERRGESEAPPTFSRIRTPSPSRKIRLRRSQDSTTCAEPGARVARSSVLVLVFSSVFWSGPWA